MRSVFALTLLLSCLAGILAQQHAMTKEIVEGCMKENGVSAQDLSDLQTGKVKPENAKDTMKCATQCVLVKSGFMDASGKLLTDNIKKVYSGSPLQAQVDKDVDKCSQIKGANACDTAYQMLTCFHGEIKKA
ncbi:general odorant-binding protein 56h isoform X1 [Drosophila bipectinata]|uniref:general odorant-binding protein 56h isoform X1 n=1 Tax=Drosophila bipectinata TaxID=42026 RepID=UPI001C89C91D|nr:general odorant-binding protein 56h [Drosophila bipectinata]